MFVLDSIEVKSLFQLVNVLISASVNFYESFDCKNIKLTEWKSFLHILLSGLLFENRLLQEKS